MYKNAHSISDVDEQLIENGVRFYLDRLLTENQINDLKLTVLLVPIVEESKGCIGQCVPPKYKNGTYQIVINPEKLTVSEIAQVAAHECVHLEQFVSGRSKIENGNFLWEGEVIELVGVPDNERPWEVEAYQKQGELYNAYCDHLDTL